jgi:hypothetical protein
VPEHKEPRARGHRHPCVWTGGPPATAPLREPLHPHPGALAVIQQPCERRARPVAADVDGALSGGVAEALATHGPAARDACADIDGVRGHKDAAVRGELEHERASTKARTTASSGSAEVAPWRHSRGPSVRESSSGMAAGGGGQAGAAGTSPKPRAMGGGVTGAAGGAVALCFLRSVKRHRHGWATRAGGNAEASATA